jgi:hypothetical protein
MTDDDDDYGGRVTMGKWFVVSVFNCRFSSMF